MLTVAGSGCVTEDTSQTDGGTIGVSETDTNSTANVETSNTPTNTTETSEDPVSVTVKFVHALDQGDAATIQTLGRSGSKLENVSSDALTEFKQAEIRLEQTKLLTRDDETATVEVTLSEANNSDSATFDLDLFQDNNMWVIDTPTWWDEYLSFQSRPTESETETIAQITNRIVEVTSVGSVHETVIDEVKHTVRLAPGSGDVNLNGVTLQLITEDNVWNLVSSNSGDVANADGVFTISSFRDDDTSISDNHTLDHQDDRAVITIGLDGSDDSIESVLDSGQTAQVTVNTESGGETTWTLVVPDSLEGKESVTL